MHGTLNVHLVAQNKDETKSSYLMYNILEKEEGRSDLVVVVGSTFEYLRVGLSTSFAPYRSQSVAYEPIAPFGPLNVSQY